MKKKSWFSSPNLKMVLFLLLSPLNVLICLPFSVGLLNRPYICLLLVKRKAIFYMKGKIVMAVSCTAIFFFFLYLTIRMLSKKIFLVDFANGPYCFLAVFSSCLCKYVFLYISTSPHSTSFEAASNCSCHFRTKDSPDF